MKHWRDLLFPLLPMSALVTGEATAMTAYDWLVNAVFVALIAFLWLTLRD